MLASPVHKFVFLMNPKTGTTSFNKSLSRYAHVKVGGNSSFKHLTYAQYRDMFGDYFDRIGAEVFITVRRPLEVLESWYRFRSDSTRYAHRAKKDLTSTADMSFAEFITAWGEPKPIRPARVTSGIDFCLTAEGTLPPEVSFYRYEDIDRLAAHLSQKIGAEITLPRLNVSANVASDIYDLGGMALPEKLLAAQDIYDRIPFR